MICGEPKESRSQDSETGAVEHTTQCSHNEPQGHKTAPAIHKHKFKQVRKQCHTNAESIERNNRISCSEQFKQKGFKIRIKPS